MEAHTWTDRLEVSNSDLLSKIGFKVQRDFVGKSFFSN